MKKIIILACILGVFLSVISCKSPSIISSANPLSLDEAKSFASQRMVSLFPSSNWTYLDSTLIYDYENKPSRYYLLFVRTEADLSYVNLDWIYNNIINSSDCYDDVVRPVCGDYDEATDTLDCTASEFELCTNFATIAVDYNSKHIKRHYGKPPFFILDKRELDNYLKENYPGKKLGRPVVVEPDITYETVFYAVLDENEDINAPLSKDSLVIANVGAQPSKAFSFISRAEDIRKERP